MSCLKVVELVMKEEVTFQNLETQTPGPRLGYWTLTASHKKWKQSGHRESHQTKGLDDIPTSGQGQIHISM